MHRSFLSFFSRRIRCISMNNLLNRVKSIGHIWCFSYPLSVMASPGWEIRLDDDPWKASVFVSAIVELFLSILLLLGAAIACITSRFAKLFGLEPPCTYTGCCHTCHTESCKGQRLPATPCFKSKDLCSGEFCPYCHPFRIHSKLDFNKGSNQEEGSCTKRGRKRSAFGWSDRNAIEQDQEVSSSHSGEYHERRCSCNNSPLYRRRNQQKGPKHTAFVCAASRDKMDENDHLLLSARSSSESSVGFAAESDCEISQVAVDSEDERAWKEAHVKRNSSVNNCLPLAQGDDGLKRHAALKNYNEKVHGISPSLCQRKQAECAEPSPLYAVHEEFGVPEVSKTNFDKFNKHGVEFADPEKQQFSQCGYVVQRSDNIKGVSNDFDMMGSHLSWSLMNGQTANSFSVPKKAQSVRERLHKDSRSVDACKEVHLNTHSPVYKGDGNTLVLLDDQHRTKTNADDITNDTEQGEEEDSGLVNIAINLRGDVQGSGSNVSELENNVQHSMFETRLEQVDQKIDDDDCLKKGLAADYLSSLELSSQAATLEMVQEASSDGGDGKDGRLSEGEKGAIETNCCFQQGEPSVKESVEGAKDVLNDTVANKSFPDELASANALARCESSSELVEERALPVSPLGAEGNEDNFLLEDEQKEGLDALKVALQAERAVLAALETELENERNAAAVATSEAMAMISRLQEEKSAMQIQVAQLQRMSEEKADYDEQAMAVLKEILFKREKENMALEREVELYRETILAEKADEVKRNLCSEGAISPHSLKPLLLTGAEEFLSSIEARNQKQALAFSEFYHLGNGSAPWKPQGVTRLDFEELNAFSLDQNLKKRPADSPWIPQGVTRLDLEELNAFSLEQNPKKQSVDSPTSDGAASMSVKLLDDEGRPIYDLDDGLHDVQNNCEQLQRMGRSVFPTNGEETQLILERLWVLEEELQKLRGKDGLGSQSKAHGIQQLAFSPTYKTADKSLEMDGSAERFVPMHDVYEVQSTLSRSPPFAEEKDPPKGLEGILGNLEMPTCSISETFSPARMGRHKLPIPPRISRARKLFPSDEAPCTPVYTLQATGWTEKCFHPEDLCDNHEFHAQSLVSRGGGMTKEEIQQLAVRLKALEEDRELLRETVDSLRRRDAELDLLEEIAQHLRELRMAGFMSVPKGVFPEDATVTSPSKNRALKKRRYGSGPGQAQLLLPQQKSI